MKIQSVKSFLLLGSNLGDRRLHLQEAADLLQACCGKISRRSSIYETAAWGKEDQPPFLNQVVELETRLEAPALMKKILELEKQMGRRRREKFGPRTIDIDILFFENEIHLEEELRIPHPALPGRRFALVPLAELAPGFIHPELHKPVSDLLNTCTDPLRVRQLD